jgi:hypothetical protein
MLFVRKKDSTYQLLETDIRIKGGGWMLVSPDVKDKLLPLLPYAKLTLDGDVIVDAEDDPEAREAAETKQPEPDLQADMAELLIDLAYRTTLLELGVSV